ncbi:porin, partial [Candidatus Parcubacteria bacterium]
IRYDSPSFSGFRVIVDYALDSNPSDGSSDNPWGLTGVYRNGPILGFVSYITNDQGGKDDAWKIGGSYDVTDDFRVFAQYENDGGLISQSSGTYWFQNGANLAPAGLKSIGTDSATHNQVDNADVWHFGLTYTLADNLLYFAFGKGGDAKGNGQSYNTSYTTWSLVGAHSFSKRTLLYAGFVEQDFDATGEGDVFALGIKHKF